MSRIIVPTFLLFFALLAVRAEATTVPTFQEVEESLTCQCGCGLTVHSCNHLQCPSAIPLRQEIREQLTKGLGKDEVLAYFSQKYGEKILSSPTTSGFNLVAWITPFLVVAFGGGVVMFTLLRWRRSPRRESIPTDGARSAPGTRAESERERALDRELDEFDR